MEFTIVLFWQISSNSLHMYIGQYPVTMCTGGAVHPGAGHLVQIRSGNTSQSQSISWCPGKPQKVLFLVPTTREREGVG